MKDIGIAFFSDGQRSNEVETQSIGVVVELVRGEEVEILMLVHGRHMEGIF